MSTFSYLKRLYVNFQLFLARTVIILPILICRGEIWTIDRPYLTVMVVESMVRAFRPSTLAYVIGFPAPLMDCCYSLHFPFSIIHFSHPRGFLQAELLS